MTSFWLWVSAGCALSALFGFAAVRLGARKLGGGPWHVEEPAADGAVDCRARRFSLSPRSTSACLRRSSKSLRCASSPEPPVEPPAAKAAAAPQAPAPAPTTVAPGREEARRSGPGRSRPGERKMSIATDGCRVTWNRTCKHGHPSWLVHLGYLKRHQLPRHNPR